ncbi:MAG: mechanosensitive ion channel family protein [Pseudomonadota bacterium]
MDFKQWLEWANKFLSNEHWVLQVFIVVFITAVLNWILRKFLRRLLDTFKNTRTAWDYALLRSAHRPIIMFVWLIGLCFAADIIYEQTDAAIFGAIDPIRSVGVIVLLAWFVVRFIARSESIIYERKIDDDPKFDRTTADAIAKLLRVSVIITSTLVILQTLGYSISGVLAFGGIGGIAVGFAARDMLANFFGGLTIYLDRPFSVGDWIRSPDKEIEGVVENIGWRLTTIRTFDKRPLYVPNATFTNIAVQNPSRMTNRRIKETIGIRYDDASKMRVIVEEVKEMLDMHDAIDNKQIVMVNFNEFDASSLNFFIYCLTKTTNWAEYHKVKQDVMLKIIDIIDSHDAECAFPTRTLHLPDGVQLVEDKPE